jgi:hypothetical protein
LTAIGRAETPLLKGLQHMLKERKRDYRNFAGRTDIVQLLLQQDEYHQQNENVNETYL